MNDYDIVDENIDRSKIKRFNYKDIIGESLTSFVTRHRNKGFSSCEIKEFIFELPRVQNFLMCHPHSKDKFVENVSISVSARCAEQNTMESMKNG